MVVGERFLAFLMHLPLHASGVILPPADTPTPTAGTERTGLGGRLVFVATRLTTIARLLIAIVATEFPAVTGLAAAISLGRHAFLRQDVRLVQSEIRASHVTIGDEAPAPVVYAHVPLCTMDTAEWQVMKSSLPRLLAFTVGSTGALVALALLGKVVVNDPAIYTVSRTDWPAAAWLLSVVSALVAGYRARIGSAPTVSVARSAAHGVVAMAIMLVSILLSGMLVGDVIGPALSADSRSPLAGEFATAALCATFAAVAWKAAALSARLLPGR